MSITQGKSRYQEPRGPKENLALLETRSDQAADNGNGHKPDQEQTEKPDQERAPRFNLTDIGNAERFAYLYGDYVKWCEVWNSWMIFNGKTWEHDQACQVDRFAKNTVRSIYVEAADEPDDAMHKRIVKHATSSESNRAINALLDRAKSELPVIPEEFNTHLHLLNCRNGTLDLRTGKLRKHNPLDMLTRCLKVAYNPQATCPKWLQFIDTIFAGNKELISFIQQALGMSLSGDVSEQCIFICHGIGSNGKTTMLETVRIILNDYGLAANIETFQHLKSDTIRNDVAELYGARFVTASENALGSRLNEAFLKKATGDEPLRARRLRENEFQFMPEFTPWLAVNHKPGVRDTSHGMWRRVHFVPFNVTIAGDKIDKHLREKLLREAEGILAWLVQGCITWYRNGRLIVPDIVREATQAYKSEMDVIANYLEERCDTSDVNAEIGATTLHENYKTWCDANGEKWEKQTTFGTQLSEKGYTKFRKPGIGRVMYRGVKLRKDCE